MTTIDSVCAICNSKTPREHYLVGHETAALQTNSKVFHLLHQYCVGTWLAAKSTCSNCKLELADKQIFQILNPNRSTIKSSVKWIGDQTIWACKKVVALSMITATAVGFAHTALMIYQSSSDIFAGMLIGSKSISIPLMFSIIPIIYNKFAGNPLENRDDILTTILPGLLLNLVIVGTSNIDRMNITLGILFGTAVTSVMINFLGKLTSLSNHDVTYNDNDLPLEHIVARISTLFCAVVGAIAGEKYAMSQTEGLGLFMQLIASISGTVLGALSFLASSITLELASTPIRNAFSIRILELDDI